MLHELNPRHYRHMRAMPDITEGHALERKLPMENSSTAPRFKDIIEAEPYWTPNGDRNATTDRFA